MIKAIRSVEKTELEANIFKTFNFRVDIGVLVC